MRLKFTPRAIDGLKRLRAFIAEHNPEAARRVSQRLKQSILHLAKNPELGKAVEELPGIRDWVAGAYLMRYVVMERNVIILKIWHGKEDR